jgi:hypothetical protein
MTWTCSTLIPSGTSESEMRDILAQMQPTGNEDAPDERDIAASTACDAATRLILSGSFGDLERGAFRVTLLGRANSIESGKIDDSVTVDVQQVEG